MSVWQVILITVISVCIGLLIKSYNPPFAAVFSLCCAVFLMLLYSESIQSVTEYLTFLSHSASLDGYMPYIMKSTGVCILGSIGVEFCKESGHTAMATALSGICKLSIILVCLPLIREITDVALSYI
jgi:stage III sporulation protein AD